MMAEVKTELDVADYEIQIFPHYDMSIKGPNIQKVENLELNELVVKNDWQNVSDNSFMVALSDDEQKIEFLKNVPGHKEPKHHETPVKIETSEGTNDFGEIHDNVYEAWKITNEEVEIKADNLEQDECNLASQDKHKRTCTRQNCQQYDETRKRNFLQYDACHSQSIKKSKLKTSLKTHLLRHKTPKEVEMFKCDQSEFQTIQKDTLRNHVLRHVNPEEVKMFKCDQCEFQTIRKDTLRNHVLRHKNPEEVKMSKCDHCGFQPIRKESLKKHVLSMLPLYDPICILLETPFSRWKNDDKRDFLNTVGATSKPFLEIEKQGKSKDRIFVRRFRNQWYSDFNWLCGSVHLKKLFCMPCLCVGVKSNKWNKAGFNNFGNVTRGCSRHEASWDHIQCALSFAKLKENLTTIEDDLRENSRLCKKQFNDNVLLNRRFMQLPIRATVYLGQQELAFREHNESDSSDTRGNFKELLDSYISISNIDIQEHYKKISSIFSENSKTIQNDLIDCISDYIDEHIDREIKECTFFSIQVDDSTDILQKSQCSLIIRYVSSAGNLVERFLGFCDVSYDRTADALFNLVTNRIENYDYRSKLVGQCYDGASVMSGHVNGLQARIKIEAPQAVFVHCATHHFNLVLQQSCSTIPQCRIFFASVNSFPSFFHRSTKMTNVADTIITKRIPTSVTTRLRSNSNIVNVIYSEWDGLKQVFTEIKDDKTSDQSSITQSVGFLNHLNNFEFALLICIFNDIFEITDIVFDTLQKRSLDVNLCMSQVRNIQNLLNEKRNKKSFQKLFDLASMRRVSVPADYRVKLETLTPKEIFEKYQVVYFEIVDIISEQINSRFKDMNKIAFVALMDATRFEEYLKDFPMESLNNLKNCFPIIFSDLSRLKNELSFIYNDENYRNIQLDRMLEMLYENRDIFKEAWKLICLIVTIPSTSVSIKRSYSCLKRIKTYLRNSITGNRLTNLAKMSIEKGLLNELISVEPFYDDIIDKFAALKNQRIDLIFKK